MHSGRLELTLLTYSRHEDNLLHHGATDMRACEHVNLKFPRVCAYQSIPVRTLPECSVRPQYPTEHSGKVRYGRNTGTRHVVKFGTISKPVPDTLVSSV